MKLFITLFAFILTLNAYGVRPIYNDTDFKADVTIGGTLSMPNLITVSEQPLAVSVVGGEFVLAPISSYNDPLTQIGDLLFHDATFTSTRLAIGSAGQVLSVVGGIPAWQDIPAVTTGTAYATAPLSIVNGGDALSKDATFSMTQADYVTDGYISASDFGNVDSKQPNRFGYANAEDNSVASWDITGIATATLTSTSSSINGSYSYQFSNITSSASEYACTPSVTLPEFGRGKHIGFRMAYNYDGNTDDMKVWLEDVTNSASMSSELLEAGSKDVLVAGFSQSTTSVVRACFQIYTENNGKNLIMDNLEFEANPLRSIKLEETQTIYYQGFTSRNASNFVLFTDETINDGDGLISVTNTDHTRFTAIKESKVVLSAGGGYSSGGLEVRLRIYNSSGTLQLEPLAASSNTGASSTVEYVMPAGYYAVVWYDNSNANGYNRNYFSIKAEAYTDATVHSDTYGKQMYSLNQAAASMSDVTKDLRFNLGTATINNDTEYGEFLVASDTGTVTIWTAQKPTSVTLFISGSGNNDASAFRIYRNTTEFYQEGNSPGANGQETAMGTVIHLNTGDYFHLYYDDTLQGTVKVNIEASPKNIPVNIITPATQTAYVVDVKPNNTAGGQVSTSLSWLTKTLNTVEGDSNILTLSANQITLSRGKYLIEATAPFKQVDAVMLRLQNITDSTTDLLGQNTWAGATDVSCNTAQIKGTIDITSTKTFELQYRVGAANTNSYAQCNAMNRGVDERYAQLKITRIGDR